MSLEAEDFRDPIEERERRRQELAALEAQTVAAFRRCLDNPDGAIVLQWLAVACRVHQRRPGLVFTRLDTHDLAAKEALRALYNEIVFMLKGAL